MTIFLSKQFLEGYRSFPVQVSTWLNSGFAFTRIYRDSPHFSLNFSIIYSLKIIDVIEYIISIDKIYLPLSILSEKWCGRISSTRFHVDVPVDKSRKLRMTRFCKNSVIRKLRGHFQAQQGPLRTQQSINIDGKFREDFENPLYFYLTRFLV